MMMASSSLQGRQAWLRAFFISIRPKVTRARAFPEAERGVYTVQFSYMKGPVVLCKNRPIFRSLGSGSGSGRMRYSPAANSSQSLLHLLLLLPPPSPESMATLKKQFNYLGASPMALTNREFEKR